MDVDPSVLSTSYPEHRDRITMVISIISAAGSYMGFPDVMTYLTKKVEVECGTDKC